MNEKKRILIIDGESYILNSYTESLREEGYEIETAACGASGIIKACRSNFDVIITGYKLSYISGLEVIKCIQKFNPGTPVILITDCPLDEHGINISKLGICDYIIKPFTRFEIIRKLKKAIKWHDNLIAVESAEINYIEKRLGKLSDIQLDYLKLRSEMRMSQLKID